MKNCYSCKKDKPLTEYYSKGKGRFQSRCKKCANQYYNERWIGRKKKAIEYLGGSCKKCGYNKFYGALEFHHLDETKKDMEWKDLRKVSWATVVEELDKCQLLCANCHRETHNEMRSAPTPVF